MAHMVAESFHVLQGFVNLKTRDSRIESALEKLSHEDLATLASKNWKQQLASESGLSYSRFHHLFKESVGLSPGHFIKHERLCEAKRLLVETQIPVKEIMFSVGFGDASHFCRDFKALTGFSPTNYRDRRGKSVGRSLQI